MTIVDNKVSLFAGIAKKLLDATIVSAIDQTKTIIDIIQIPYSFCVEGAAAYCSALVGTATADVRIVPVHPSGSVIDAVVLTIGGDATDFKLNSAVRGLLPQAVSPAVSPAMVYKAITDNIDFTTNFTVNVAAAAGLFWGAVRVQMDAHRAITTKVVADNQVFLTEVAALAAVPLNDVGHIDLGTITIQMKTASAFTANTTALNDASTNAVNYYGRASSAVSCLTGEVAFVATEKVNAVSVAKIISRACTRPGGLLIIDYTTNHTGVLTNGQLHVAYRPYPMAGETTVAGSLNAA